ncbi:ATP-binding protein [Scytonema sp. PRP1]|uniref:ATP-binding protein n=1 Tax=Scytonema sp. PRP1 TaxID=3120513 RepID=UPI002FD36CB8
MWRLCGGAVARGSWVLKDHVSTNLHCRKIHKIYLTNLCVLGLVILRKCVDLHGGEIRIKSKEGVGTTITVRLPMHPPGNSEE